MSSEFDSNAPERPAVVARRQFLLGGSALTGYSLASFWGLFRQGACFASGAEETPMNQPSDAIDAETIRAAERLAGVHYEDAERELMAQTIARDVRRMQSRHGYAIDNGVAPATVFTPDGIAAATASDTSVGHRMSRRALPKSDDDIAFAPIRDLAHWLRTKQLTSRRLTDISISRLERYGPKLESVITLTKDLAYEQAERADRELASGIDRGPLHGLPYGAKDLFDTAAIRTTWGAAPYRDRVPTTNASAIDRLERAGAVLVAKTTLGALAMGDVWFGGKTRNPWHPEQGSSGSSAGSASGVAAGLFAFSIGTETHGSIVSPTARCGVTGLRPTFGRVSRGGAMALCWSLDKIGPICRTVEDSILVLAALHGHDARDPSSVDRPLHYAPDRELEGLKLGYVKSWFSGRRASAHDRAALDCAKQLGLELVELEFPRLPYGVLMNILYVEAAAAFEDLTLSNRDDELRAQDSGAWPNTFRKARFVPAIDYVQAQRIRRQVVAMMDAHFENVDAIIGPNFAGNMLLITNHSGHPSLTFRTAFDRGQPQTTTLWGRRFDEGTICRIGESIEARLAEAWRPDLSALA